MAYGLSMRVTEMVTKSTKGMPSTFWPKTKMSAPRKNRSTLFLMRTNTQNNDERLPAKPKRSGVADDRF